MSENHKHQGWKNYETWAVKLWMDNDEGSYNYWKERTEEIADDAEERDDAISTLADALKDEHEEALPELTGFAADLLTGAFGEVDWYEIAESLLGDFAYDDDDGEATG